MNNNEVSIEMYKQEISSPEGKNRLFKSRLQNISVACMTRIINEYKRSLSEHT